MCPVLYYTMIRQSKDPKYIRLEIVWFAELSSALQICPTLKAKKKGGGYDVLPRPYCQRIYEEGNIENMGLPRK